MGKTQLRKSDGAVQRAALRKHIRDLYRNFNSGEWDACFKHIDPKLKAGARVQPDHYVASLSEFHRLHGRIEIWYIRLSLHLDVTPRQSDSRPFAYAYILWQDEHNSVHLFRERWVMHRGRWYTRVVGLVG